MRDPAERDIIVVRDYDGFTATVVERIRTLVYSRVRYDSKGQRHRYYAVKYKGKVYKVYNLPECYGPISGNVISLTHSDRYENKRGNPSLARHNPYGSGGNMHDLDDAIETIRCGACGTVGACVPLGAMGNHEWYRCKACGMDVSVPRKFYVPPRSKAKKAAQRENPMSRSATIRGKSHSLSMERGWPS